MAISEHPTIGTILIADFNSGFRTPEMVKRRPVVVISPRIGGRSNLCTVVALSSTEPKPKKPYHCTLNIDPPLPAPWTADSWVKGDMVYALGFHRLNLIVLGKDRGGKRIYRYDILTKDQMTEVRKCVLHGMGMHHLTSFL
jgi:uncharacterized protein YifN (PemK superfamily)